MPETLWMQLQATWTSGIPRTDYLVPAHGELGVPPDGQRSLETAVAAAVAAPPRAASSPLQACCCPAAAHQPPLQQFLQFNMDPELQ